MNLLPTEQKVRKQSIFVSSTKHQPSGFALVATVSMMVLLTLIALGMLSLATLEQRSSGGGADDADSKHAPMPAWH